MGIFKIVTTRQTIMKKIYYYLLSLLIIRDLYSHTIILATDTKNKEEVLIDSELLTVGELPSSEDEGEVSNSIFLRCDYIECPAKFKNTLTRIVLLLNHRKKGENEKVREFFNKEYRSLSHQEIADLLNTFFYLKLEGLLGLALLRCPENQEKEIFSFCSDELNKKIQPSFNSFLQVKVPLQNGGIKCINVPFTSALFLPRIESIFFESRNESLDLQSIKIKLLDDCVPLIDIDDLDDFFNVFFSAVVQFKINGTVDSYSTLKNELLKTRLYSMQNLAVFCNLLHFFECFSLFKDFITSLITEKSLTWYIPIPERQEFFRHLNPANKIYMETYCSKGQYYVQGLLLTTVGFIYAANKFSK